MHPQSWGFYQSFNLGPEWRNGWTHGLAERLDAARRKAAARGATGTIHFDRQPEAEYYGAAVQLSAPGPIAGPVGFAFGDGLSLTWDPTHGPPGRSAGLPAAAQCPERFLGR